MTFKVGDEVEVISHMYYNGTKGKILLIHDLSYTIVTEFNDVQLTLLKQNFKLTDNYIFNDKFEEHLNG